MFSATGVANYGDVVSVGRCSTGGLWIQVIEAEDQEGRGAYLEISKVDFERFSKFMTAESYQMTLPLID